MTVIRLENYEMLSRRAADLFVRKAAESVRMKGRFSVALSGGDTPVGMYELLTRPPWVDQVPWNKTHIFWGDERCVPFNDRRHNAWIAKDILLSHVPVPETQVHPVSCLENPSATASVYEDDLRSFFAGQDTGFDLFLLGIGTDGHTASLFPGLPVLEERQRWVREVMVPGQPFARITMTLPLIERSSLIVFLVSGAAKAPIVKRLIGQQNKEDVFPAAMIRTLNGECIWLLDQAAAGLLES